MLVFGGYGGFGARLSRRLVGRGWEVIVAGRNADAGRAFCATLPGARPIVADRNGLLALLLADLRPDLVIDAAGPFQGSGHHVACACIAASVSYLDLADARDFVAGVDALHEAAVEAGVCVIAGASSVPALSGAVIRRLTRGMEEVHAVDVAISASNRATAGPSVAAAILSTVGKPVLLWRGGRWTRATGWRMLRRETFAIAGMTPLTRLVALADVPDHDITPRDMPGAPAKTFRAGPEFAFQLLAVWLLSWLVQWRWLQSLSPLAPRLQRLQALTRHLGSDRSAMAVEVGGLVQGRPLRRRWSLIAEQGDGPEIPTLAAELVAEMIARREVAPGAAHAGALLCLAQFEPLFGALAIRHLETEVAFQPLYRRVMGARFDAAPPAVRAMHTFVGDGWAEGRAVVARGTSWPARLVCCVMGFPEAGEAALHVSFSERNGVERWTRDFDGRTFSSELRQRGRRLVERFGPLRFAFELPSRDAGLEMALRRWSILQVPMPLALAPRCVAREWEEDGEFRFDIDLALPWGAPLVRYTGGLRRSSAPPP